jgi:hypothetical protein
MRCGPHTNRREQELVKCHSAECICSALAFSDRKYPAEEAEPLVLYGCHHEPIRHEPRQSLEVERWRTTLRCGRHIVVFRPGHLLVQILYLNREKALLAIVGMECLVPLSLSDRCESLCHRIRDSSQYLCAWSQVKDAAARQA